LGYIIVIKSDRLNPLLKGGRQTFRFDGGFGRSYTEELCFAVDHNQTPRSLTMFTSVPLSKGGKCRHSKTLKQKTMFHLLISGLPRGFASRKDEAGEMREVADKDVENAIYLGKTISEIFGF
jgi:hypothetical protein